MNTNMLQPTTGMTYLTNDKTMHTTNCTTQNEFGKRKKACLQTPTRDITA